jgi:hypothetical protein
MAHRAFTMLENIPGSIGSSGAFNSLERGSGRNALHDWD